jgi:SHS2 domain-containing protein
VAYGWGEHVGELELWVRAPSREAVFEEALRALAELMDAGDDATERRQISIDGNDLPVMLADWLAELAFLAETEGFVPQALDALELRTDGLQATVAGEIGEPAHLVKAVTYHRLTFEPHGDGWRAVAVLDV